jgi:septal ring factor EnvC (AmiA/AmiB activator)
MSEPGPIKFPLRRDTLPPLTLPRRRGLAIPASTNVLDATAAARESIQAIVAATRSPFGVGPDLSLEKVLELERTLRILERSLAERERVIAETESRLAERERDVAEAEALLLAREHLIAATRLTGTGGSGSPEELAALAKVKSELERQEATLLDAKQAVRDREIFLDESETRLFEKVQAQQDKENELEQREEDLRIRMRRLREQEARYDPKVAAALKAEDEAAKKRDEFNE